MMRCHVFVTAAVHFVEQAGRFRAGASAAVGVGCALRRLVESKGFG